MRKTFAAGAATSGTGCRTRVSRELARISRSRRNVTIQAARRFDDGLSIILIRVLSIIVTTLTHAEIVIEHGWSSSPGL
jgi:hypothetical protein